MGNATAAAAALAAAVVISLVWGRVLGYLHDQSDLFRRAALAAMGFSSRAPAEVRALMLSAIYYGVGLLAVVVMAVMFDIRLSSLASWSDAHGWMVLLGAVGEISLASLFVDLLCRLTHSSPQRFSEIEDIPWMVGLRQLPRGTAPVGAALGGMIEELFYRGVLLMILIERAGVAPVEAVVAAGTLFCLQQLLQVRTAFQAMVLGSACIAISLVGGLLVVTTGSVVPALLAHASFVVFFVGRKSDREPSRRVAENVAL